MWQSSVESDINSSTKYTLALDMEDLFIVEIHLSVEPPPSLQSQPLPQ